MRYYEFTIKGKLEAQDNEKADTFASELAATLVEYGGDLIDVESLRWDTAIMPQDYLEAPQSRAVDTVEAIEARYEEVPPEYPSDMPPHPWDEGLHIFPVDHPYRDLEDFFMRKEMGDEVRTEAAEVLKQLPPPKE
jgi:hypothetical protein